MTPLDLSAIRQRLAVDDDDCYGNDRVALLALVEIQTRALLAVEWFRTVCPVCREQKRDESVNPEGGHMPGCTTDAALTSAGLDTAEKRDAARKATR